MTADLSTVPALLVRLGRDCPDRRAIVTADDAITYQTLVDDSATVAARLIAAGVSKGDRVGLLGPNGIEWATTFLAVVRIGAVLVPLSTLLRPPELLAQLRTAAVTHLITAESFRNRSYLDDLEVAAPGVRAACDDGRRHAALPNLRAVWLLGRLPEDTAPELVSGLEARVQPADDLVVLFTSGSSGAPKGIVHTHGGALRAAAAGLESRCIGDGEILYIPMPFFWTGGFSSGLVSALVAGATLLTEAEPEPARTLALLERERVTLFRGWPDQAARLAAHPAFTSTDLSSLGDGSLPAVLPADRRPAPGARANVFGMTESFGPYCGSRLDRDLPAGKQGSCGRPFEGVEVRIVDPDTGVVLDGGDEGEILLRGPNLLRGICGRLRSEVFTPDGFYRTGDRGRLDEDGYLWYGGRLDDMFKVKGATVYPSEVEAALRSIDVVRHAHVTDVAVDGGPPQVGAVVITDSTVEEIAAAVRSTLSAFKVPARWLLSPDPDIVPMLATGKVDKRGLRELLVEHGR